MSIGFVLYTCTFTGCVHPWGIPEVEERNLVWKESQKQGTNAEPKLSEVMTDFRSLCPCCTFPSSTLFLLAWTTYDHSFSALLFLVCPPLANFLVYQMFSNNGLLAYNTMINWVQEIQGLPFVHILLTLFGPICGLCGQSKDCCAKLGFELGAGLS